MVRIVAVGATLVALLIAVKDHRLLQRGASRRLVLHGRARAGRQRMAGVRSGEALGPAGLELNSCTDLGRHRNAEIWACPAQLNDRAQRG